MNVYVESGFIVTLALQQDDHRAAERLLTLAEQGRIALKIPAFSLSEPFATVQHRANIRNRMIDELRKELRELGRTQPHLAMATEVGQYTIQMAQILETQSDALEQVVLKVSRGCTLLALDADVLARAATYKRTFSLSLQDGIILASVVRDLEQTDSPDEALFISQNVKDFEHPAVQEALRQRRCKYLADFANAVRYIERPAT